MDLIVTKIEIGCCFFLVQHSYSFGLLGVSPGEVPLQYHYKNIYYIILTHKRMTQFLWGLVSAL